MRITVATIFALLISMTSVRAQLTTVDRKARSLVISVRSSSRHQGADSQLSASGDMGFGNSRVRVNGGSVGNNGGSISFGGARGSMNVRSSETSVTHTSASTQQLRVMDGGRGTIQVDGRFFEAQPMLRGDQVEVTLKESSQDGTRRGALETTVSGGLGRWIPVGGIGGSSETRNSAIGSRTRNAQEGRSGLSLRVDLAR